MALEVTDARYGIVRLLSPGGTLVTGSVAGENLDRPLVEALELAPSTITGWVATHRQPLCITDLHDKPWSALYYPLDRAHEMRSELAVPLLGGGGRLEGVLNLESPRVAAFGDPDRLLLQALATQAVIAIQEARLLDALQETAEHLLAWPCARVLQRVVEQARELLGGNAAMLVTSDGVRAATSDTQSDWPYRIEVPVRAEGTLGVYGDSVRPDAEWDRKVLGCLAHYAALALENESRQELLQTTREQRAVAEMFAAVGDVAANLLHQLNNKLGIIPVRVQSLQDKCAGELAANPYLTKQLAEIQRSAQEAIAVMRDNLKLLRPAASGPVTLSRCVAQALRMLEMPPGVEVGVEDLEALPPVVAEESSLALVFFNLFENAMAAMAGHGRITVRGSAASGATRVAVSDSGPGIAPELQDRIFEFNYSGRSGKFGFGLWWVRTHMRRLGGSVMVESDGRRGTTFRLVFPS
ncbi:MAG: GAF domain-containing protein, partial [Candidatus Xenobia bacterium]